MENSTNVIPAFFQIKLIFCKRQFVGNRVGPQVFEKDVSVNSPEQFINEVWDVAKSHISQEIVVTGEDQFTWNRQDSRGVEEIDKFVQIQDKVGKKTFTPSTIKYDTLRVFKNKGIVILIYEYSISMSNQKIWTKANKKLIEPALRDRAGATANQEFQQLIAELRETHGFHLEADASCWGQWANFIQKQSPAEHESFVRRFPPDHLSHLFTAIPTSAAATLNSIRHGLTVAQNVSSIAINDIQQIRNEFNTIKSTAENLKIVVDSFVVGINNFGSRLVVIENKAIEHANLIKGMESAATPEESVFSKSIAEKVTDEFDYDHA